MPRPPEDPEGNALEVERKRRRLEDQMEEILRRKKSIDESLARYKIPKKPAKETEEQVREVEPTVPAPTPTPTEEEVIPPPPRTPEPQEEEEEEIFDYEEEDPSENWEDIEGESPEENPDTYPSRPSPPDDLTSYNAIIKRAADTYGVQLEEERPDTCFLLNRLATYSRGATFLPMLPSMLDLGKDAFKEPATAKGVTPRVEKKYKASTRDPVYIRGNVPADSLIVATARRRANAPTSTGPPPDKESKRLDMVGKKMEREAATQWRIANSQALLNRYAQDNFDQIEDLTSTLADDLKKKLFSHSRGKRHR